MTRFLFVLGLLIAAPTISYAFEFPNKPGKKTEPRLIVGAQSGAISPPTEDVVIGAGALGTKSGGGDYGLIAPTPLKSPRPKRSIGYDPSARLGNKLPNS